MSYELQIYAPGGEPPSVEALLAHAQESGVGVEVAEPPQFVEGSGHWSRLKLRASEGAGTGFTIEAAPELDRMKELLTQDAESGEDIPLEVLAAQRLYVLELAEEADEASQAAFVVTAWGLASLADAIVFDPQEEFFADADSFWGLVMDEGLGEEDEGQGGQEDGGCCGGHDDQEAHGGLIMPHVPRRTEDGSR